MVPDALTPELSTRWIPVRGDSMWPSLRDGDAVLCEPMRAALPGEVVVAKLGTRLVIHRVVIWSEARVELRGDNAPESDAPLSPALIIGRVTTVRRGEQELPFSAVDRGPRLSGRARVRLKRAVSGVLRRLPWR